MSSSNPFKKQFRRHTRHWLSELRNMGYGKAIWLVRHNSDFLLKLALFVLIFLLVMVGEFVVVMHLNHAMKAKSFLATAKAAFSPSFSLVASHSTPVPPQILLRQALWLTQQNQLDPALLKVNTVIQMSPDNPDAYILRGHIFAGQKQWDSAERDFKRVIQILGDDPQARFDLAEIQFMQHNYDTARPDFVALEQDVYIGDLAKYKVYLCDLFGGHEDVAARSLQSFNAVGANASYYFGNAAWALYHHKPQEARGWLNSAANIYSPEKFEIYSASLIALGYLPLPPQI